MKHEDGADSNCFAVDFDYIYYRHLVMKAKPKNNIFVISCWLVEIRQLSLSYGAMIHCNHYPERNSAEGLNADEDYLLPCLNPSKYSGNYVYHLI